MSHHIRISSNVASHVDISVVVSFNPFYIVFLRVNNNHLGDIRLHWKL